MEFELFQVIELIGLAVTVAIIVNSNKNRSEENKRNNAEIKISICTLQNSIKEDMSTHIGYIKEDISRLETKQDKHNGLIERMVKVEESVKSAHHRIDEKEGGETHD